MKRMLLGIILFLIMCSNYYAQSIAVELRENGKFVGIIGKVFYTGEAIKMVTFAKINGLPNIDIG